MNLKQRYNTQLAQYRLGEKWLDRQGADVKKEHLDRLLAIAKELSRMLNEIGEYSDEQAAEGFG